MTQNPTGGGLASPRRAKRPKPTKVDHWWSRWALGCFIAAAYPFIFVKVFGTQSDALTGILVWLSAIGVNLILIFISAIALASKKRVTNPWIWLALAFSLAVPALGLLFWGSMSSAMSRF